MERPNIYHNTLTSEATSDNTHLYGMNNMDLRRSGRIRHVILAGILLIMVSGPALGSPLHTLTEGYLVVNERVFHKGEQDTGPFGQIHSPSGIPDFHIATNSRGALYAPRNGVRRLDISFDMTPPNRFPLGYDITYRNQPKTQYPSNNNIDFETEPSGPGGLKKGPTYYDRYMTIGTPPGSDGTYHIHMNVFPSVDKARFSLSSDHKTVVSDTFSYPGPSANITSLMFQDVGNAKSGATIKGLTIKTSDEGSNISNLKPTFDKAINININGTPLRVLIGGTQAYNSDWYGHLGFITPSGNIMKPSTITAGKALAVSESLQNTLGAHVDHLTNIVKHDMSVVSWSDMGFASLEAFQSAAANSLVGNRIEAISSALSGAVQNLNRDHVLQLLAGVEITAGEQDGKQLKKLQAKIRNSMNSGTEISYSDVKSAYSEWRNMYAAYNTAVQILASTIGGSTNPFVNLYNDLKDVGTQMALTKAKSPLLDKIEAFKGDLTFAQEILSVNKTEQKWRNNAYSWFSDSSIKQEGQVAQRAGWTKGTHSQLKQLNPVKSASYEWINTPLKKSILSNGSTVNSYDFIVKANTVVKLDPSLATAYTYSIGPGDPNFASVMFPQIIPQQYELWLFGADGSPYRTGITINPGQWFNFTKELAAFGIGPKGIGKFLISGVNTNLFAQRYPGQNFLTSLKFVGDGNFTGTQTAMLTSPHSTAVPEPPVLLVFLSGLLGLGVILRRSC